MWGGGGSHLRRGNQIDHLTLKVASGDTGSRKPRPRPHVSGYFGIRNFFFPDTKISASTRYAITAYSYVYIIDQVRGQDGWILVEFSFCVFMDRDEVEVHENAKRERGQYPAILTELAWSIKDLLYGIKSTEKNDLRSCLFSSTEKEPS